MRLIDENLNIFTVSSVGHRLWRKEYFPKVAFSLFKRYVKDADSQLCSQEFENGELEERKEETYCQFDVQEQREAAAVSTTGIQMFTSTPITQRPDQRSEQSASQNSTFSECILCIFNILRDIETELKAIKQNVVSCMERKTDDFK